MPTYITPIKDIMYNLTDVLNIEQYQSFPGFEDATEDLFKAILEESGKLCEEVLLPAIKMALSQPQKGLKKLINFIAKVVGWVLAKTLNMEDKDCLILLLFY